MRTFKILAMIIGGLLAVVLMGYGLSRVRTVNKPLSVYSIQQKIGSPKSYDSTTIRIASYNIAHGRGGKTGAKNRGHRSEKALIEHLDKIAGQIKKANVDLIVLNEADFSSTWSYHINQAAYIAQKCGFSHVLEQKNIGFSFPFYRLHFGNALLSRFPIQNERFIDFEPYSGVEDMLAGNHDGFFCEIILPSGPVGIIGIHFEYRSETVRVRCAEVLANLGAELNIPVIALGDFNSTPSGLSKSRMSKKGKNALSFLLSEKRFVSYLKEENQKKSYTFPSEKPDRLIDWIIGKGGVNFSGSKIIQSDLADHLMIVTEVELQN